MLHNRSKTSSVKRIRKNGLPTRGKCLKRMPHYVSVSGHAMRIGTLNSSFMALATTSRPHQASPLAAPQMDAQFDVRNVLHSVDLTSSLLCSWRSKAAARKLRWRQQTHTLRMCPTRGAPPKATVHTEALARVPQHSGDRCGRFRL